MNCVKLSMSTVIGNVTNDPSSNTRYEVAKTPAPSSISEVRSRARIVINQGGLRSYESGTLRPYASACRRAWSPRDPRKIRRPLAGPSVLQPGLGLKQRERGGRCDRRGSNRRSLRGTIALRRVPGENRMRACRTRFPSGSYGDCDWRNPRHQRWRLHVAMIHDMI